MSFKLIVFSLTLFLIFTKNVTNSEIKQLAFERFKLKDKETNNNKEAYTLIYIPADLSSRTMLKHSIISWWSKRRLIWLLKNHPPTLTREQTVYAFQRAFFLWSNQTALLFKPACLFGQKTNETSCVDLNQNKNVKVDITIEFAKYNQHDFKCQYKFSDSTLAHAFYPEKGIVHFNMDKNWYIRNYNF